MRILFRCKDTN